MPRARLRDLGLSVGTLPPGLDGLFVRNGPNPQFLPLGPYHWFDGDGMLHGVRIRDGKASYLNRYVRTEGFIEEMMAGQKVIKVFCHEDEAKAGFDEVNDELFHDSEKANTFANILAPVIMNIAMVRL